ncbi:MAG: Holliday junction resolvase RuvX [Bacteroidales bacterium]|nr:Holliday junction resolvase RuvX [Bacteroidales bacterium]
MGRILAVDYGEKRVGLAVSDTMQIIANNLTTVSTLEVYNYLEQYLEKEEVDMIVVGNPKQLDNTPSQSAKAVRVFVENLARLLPEVEIFMIDERYTSKIASQSIAKSGLKKQKRQDKALIDSVSAVLILQDFMEMRKGAGQDNIIKIER